MTHSQKRADQTLLLFVCGQSNIPKQYMHFKTQAKRIAGIIIIIIVERERERAAYQLSDDGVR